MRIERVVARAFGPFRDQELRLAPGLTVVAGPNEAGKSSWHAALRLALTGVRRGKGPGTVAERQLAERHRPWDEPDRWQVEARLQLADGRTIEIHQDLAGKVDCRAVDVGLGRDVSAEILDGTPDASRWLGLNRDAFAATVSVSQAQILAVTEAADQLQEQMQRAAATDDGDSTAAEAIGRLEQFRRDAVGIDRIGARGPLRTAKDRLAALEGRLAEVRRLHEEYLERSAEVEAAERRVAEARELVLRGEAALAAGRAAEARRRHSQAAELASRHPAAPEALEARDARADMVAGAIDAWASRPTPTVLGGLTAAELDAELASLPSAPEGDTEPHPAAREALRALDLAEGAIELLESEPRAIADELPEVDESRVRELARRLRTPQLPGAAGLEAELASARGAAAAASRPPASAPLAAGAGLALIGIALLLLGQLTAGGGLLGLALAAGGWWWLAGATRRRAAARLARAEAALAPYREARRLAERDRAAAELEASQAGLPADATQLDQLADRLASAAAARRGAADRVERRAALDLRRAAAAEALLTVLAERGEAAVGDPRAAWSAYEAACRRRAEQASAAARREALLQQLQARRSAEESSGAAAEAVAGAERRLGEALSLLGLDAMGESDELVDRLRAWQGQRSERLRQNEAAIGEWQRLQSLLGGRSVVELESAAVAAERHAAGLAARLEEPLGGLIEAPDRIESRLSGLRERLLSATSAADALRGNLDARRESLPDVAEAEESLDAARAELRRVEDLGETLDRTIALLRSAEERVHRSLAPVLAASIGRWLPVVCAGAYQEVSVDPADLSIRVKESASGKWREARLLSEGTREQVYLLLRVAMAEHLVTNGETAPLLLDEVTVQSDADRKRQLLDVLHRLSAERQVVLFTHDDDVLQWAAERLAPGRDATVHLPTLAAEAPPPRPKAVPVEEPTAPMAVAD